MSVWMVFIIHITLGSCWIILFRTEDKEMIESLGGGILETVTLGVILEEVSFEGDIEGVITQK